MQRIPALELKPAVAHTGKRVALQARGRGSRRPLEIGDQPVEKVVRGGGEVELSIRVGPVFLPVAAVVDQVPEGNMLTAFAEEQAAGVNALRVAKANAISQMRRSIAPFSAR